MVFENGPRTLGSCVLLCEKRIWQAFITNDMWSKTEGKNVVDRLEKGLRRTDECCKLGREANSISQTMRALSAWMNSEKRDVSKLRHESGQTVEINK